MLTLARLFVVVFGGLIIIFGLWLATVGNEGDLGLVIVGLLTALFGALGIGVLAFERMRYRSAAAETRESTGSPAGRRPACRSRRASCRRRRLRRPRFREDDARLFRSVDRRTALPGRRLSPLQVPSPTRCPGRRTRRAGLE